MENKGDEVEASIPEDARDLDEARAAGDDEVANNGDVEASENAEEQSMTRTDRPKELKLTDSAAD